jgi:hypothetical protein
MTTAQQAFASAAADINLTVSGSLSLLDDVNVCVSTIPGVSPWTPGHYVKLESSGLMSTHYKSVLAYLRLDGLKNVPSGASALSPIVSILGSELYMYLSTCGGWTAFKFDTNPANL